MTRLLHIPDLHLGLGGSCLNLFNSTERMRYQTLIVRKALRVAVEVSANVVVFNGDTFDTPVPDGWALEMLVTELLRAREHWQFNVLIYTGNHEVENSTTDAMYYIRAVAAVTDFIRVVSEPSTVRYGINGRDIVRVLPWPHTEAGPSDKPALVLAHTEFNSAVYDNGMAVRDRAVFNQSKAREESQVWVSGHLHTRQENGALIYPGSLYTTTPLSLDGDNLRQHYMLMTTLKNNKVSNKKWIPFDPLCHMVSTSLSIVEPSVVARLFSENGERLRMKLDLGKDMFPPELVKYKKYITVGPTRRHASANDKAPKPITPMEASIIPTTYEDLSKMVFSSVADTLSLTKPRRRKLADLMDRAPNPMK